MVKSSLDIKQSAQKELDALDDTLFARIDRKILALAVVLDIVDEVFGIEKADVLRAGEIAESRSSMSARDAVHIAVMERHEVRSILSFDGAFDRWPGLTGIHRV